MGVLSQSTPFRVECHLTFVQLILSTEEATALLRSTQTSTIDMPVTQATHPISTRQSSLFRKRRSTLLERESTLHAHAKRPDLVRYPIAPLTTVKTPTRLAQAVLSRQASRNSTPEGLRHWSAVTIFPSSSQMSTLLESNRSTGLPWWRG